MLVLTLECFHALNDVEEIDFRVAKVWSFAPVDAVLNVSLGFFQSDAMVLGGHTSALLGLFQSVIGA